MLQPWFVSHLHPIAVNGDLNMSPQSGGLNECLRLIKKEPGVMSPSQGTLAQSVGPSASAGDPLSRPGSTNPQMASGPSGPFQPVGSQATPKVRMPEVPWSQPYIHDRESVSIWFGFALREQLNYDFPNAADLCPLQMSPSPAGRSATPQSQAGSQVGEPTGLRQPQQMPPPPQCSPSPAQLFNPQQAAQQQPMQSGPPAPMSHPSQAVAPNQGAAREIGSMQSNQHRRL